MDSNFSQQIYIVPIDGKDKPVELTSGEQGAIHAPVFNTQGTKVAWLELDKDGYESDRYGLRLEYQSITF